MDRDSRHASRASAVCRAYGVLLVAYPAAERERFEDGMREAIARDFVLARSHGLRAVANFWIITVMQAIGFGLAARWSCFRKGLTMRSLFSFDWRHAARSLRATPVVTAVAVLSLGLGIGANTALFSILNSLVLKPLPVHDPGQLVLLADGSWTNPIWEEIRDRHADLFNGAFAWSNERFNLSEQGETDFVDGAYASGAIFEVLGVPARLGRTITPADDVRGGGPDGAVAVISYGFWQRRFGGAENVIGQKLIVDHTAFTVIGVTPQGFFGPDVGRVTDVVIPIGDEPLVHGAETRLGQGTNSNWWLELIMRLKPGQTIDQADAALRGVQPQIRVATMPPGWGPEQRANYLKPALTFVSAATGNSELRARFEQPLTIIMVVVGMVLLIACANIANLLLARATARRHEWSVRLALGASRGRLARQMLAESLMLAMMGALAGLAFAKWGSALLVRQLESSTNAVFLDLSLDWRVLAFTIGVAVVTALLFGLAPALTASRVAPNDALKEQGRSVAGDRHYGVRNALVVAQVALSLSLVVAAGLFIRTFASLTTTSLGFDPTPLIVVNVSAQAGQVPPDDRAAWYERLRLAAASVSGVKSVAASMITPVSGVGWNTTIKTPEVPGLTGRARIAWVNAISRGWFATYGMHLVAGRDVSAEDRTGGPGVVVINETLARRFFSGQNPVGRELSADLHGVSADAVTVVGVVSDSVYRSSRTGMAPTMFVPIAQAAGLRPSIALTVSAAGAEGPALQRNLAAAIGREDAHAAVTFRSYAEQIRASVTQERLVAMLSGFFGGLALLLAGLGLYGVTAYAVSRRLVEIGVRLALGADPSSIIALVLRRVAWLVGTGIIIGAGLSFWASHFVTKLLFNLDPRDPITFVTAAVVLMAVGLLAGWLPARRAGRIDPVQVLRS